MTNTPWRNDKWYTSFWNHDEKAKAFYQFADKIEYHDVTLRDGEQQSGLVFSKDQKIAIAEKLAEIGIHRIEAGMPIVCKQDEEAIREIAKRKLGPKIFTFARCIPDDAQLAKDLGADGIIMEIPGNELLLKHGFKWEVQRAIDAAVKATSYAHQEGLYVTLFLIDYSRAELSYTTNFLNQVKANGGYFDSLACVDTMGVLNPIGAYYMIKNMKESYPDTKIEIHAHDDFGMSAAVTTMALAAGAAVAHTTIAGIGERAGNTPYEDVAWSLLTLFGKDTGLKYEKLYETAHFILDMGKIPCRPNKCIIGPDVSKMEAGLPIGWYESIKHVNPLILFPYRFPLVGHPEVSYTIGKYSGAPTIQFYLREMGLPDSNETFVRELLNAVKEMAFDLGHALNLDQFKTLANKYYEKYK